jgi:hypothetical protein
VTKQIGIFWNLLAFLCKKTPKICKTFWKNRQTFRTTKLCNFFKNNSKKQTSDVNVSTSKMLEVLGKRLHQV